MTKSRQEPTYHDVLVAQERIASAVNHPDAIYSEATSTLVGAEVWLLPENQQPTGSFKDRGACNAMAVLAAEGQTASCAISSGNHAVAVARAAYRYDIKMSVHMPTDAPPEKKAQTKEWGAKVTHYNRYTDGPQAAIGQAFADSLNLPLLSPYDNRHVIAGAGTAALDYLTQFDEGLDFIIGPLGGGGLMAGTAIATHERLPDCKLIGVEPGQHRMWANSLLAGKRLEFPVPDTIADGQQLTVPGEWTFPIIQRHGVQAVSPKEATIVKAMAWLFDHHKLIAEPSGAIALAALLDKPSPTPQLPKGSRVGVFISGHNIGFLRFTETPTQKSLS